MEAGDLYSIDFKCDGDYLAYFSISYHKQLTLKQLINEYGLSDLVNLINENPPVDSIAKYASEQLVWRWR